MRAASRDKATPLEEGGRKDNLDRCQPPFGKVRGVANRSACLDGIDRALAHSLHDDHSQTAWLGDAICTRHRDAKRAFFWFTGFGYPDSAHWFCGCVEV